MKRINITTLTVMMFAMCFTNGFAQTDEDYEMLKKRVTEKVSMLNDYIAFMANPQKPQNTRFQYKTRAQRLFINNCDNYTEVVRYRNGTEKEVMREGVFMETVSLRNRTPNKQLMKSYFRGIINMSYKSVTIQTTDAEAMRVSKLRPYGRDAEGRQMYACTVYFDQLFRGVRGDGGVYQDITHKWAVCYVTVDDVIDNSGGKPEYMVQLGDIHVQSVERVR